jgi:hypothetical protein
MEVFFNEYNIEQAKKCKNDYVSASNIKVKVKKKWKTKTIKLCGSKKKKKYTVSKKSTTIKFRSNNKSNKKGFSAKISSK